MSIVDLGFHDVFPDIQGYRGHGKRTSGSMANTCSKDNDFHSAYLIGYTVRVTKVRDVTITTFKKCFVNGPKLYLIH